MKDAEPDDRLSVSSPVEDSSVISDHALSSELSLESLLSDKTVAAYCALFASRVVRWARRPGGTLLMALYCLFLLMAATGGDAVESVETYSIAVMENVSGLAPSRNVSMVIRTMEAVSAHVQ